MDTVGPMTKKIVLCADCTIALVNDDYSGMTTERAEEVSDGLEELPDYVAPADEEDDFSTAPCDACGTHLAGYRHHFLGEEF